LQLVQSLSQEELNLFQIIEKPLPSLRVEQNRFIVVELIEIAFFTLHVDFHAALVDVDDLDAWRLFDFL